MCTFMVHIANNPKIPVSAISYENQIFKGRLSFSKMYSNYELNFFVHYIATQCYLTSWHPATQLWYPYKLDTCIVAIVL